MISHEIHVAFLLRITFYLNSMSLVSSHAVVSIYNSTHTHHGTISLTSMGVILFHYDVTLSTERIIAEA